MRGAGSTLSRPTGENWGHVTSVEALRLISRTTKGRAATASQLWPHVAREPPGGDRLDDPALAYAQRLIQPRDLRRCLVAGDGTRPEGFGHEGDGVHDVLEGVARVDHEPPAAVIRGEALDLDREQVIRAVLDADEQHLARLHRLDDEEDHREKHPEEQRSHGQDGRLPCRDADDAGLHRSHEHHKEPVDRDERDRTSGRHPPWSAGTCGIWPGSA